VRTGCSYRPREWLFFNSRNPGKPLDKHTVHRNYQRAKAGAGITKAGGIHALRHAFATHMLEGGVHVPSIQRLIGHGHMGTTARYFHLANKHLAGTPSPLELLDTVGAASQLRTVHEHPPSADATGKLGLAQILARHGKAFGEAHALSATQRRVIRAIEACRTSTLGGHLEQCDGCAAKRYLYHSCRNRHCPKCQTRAKEHLACEPAG
jgi:hypothetical protein